MARLADTESDDELHNRVQALVLSHYVKILMKITLL